MNITESRFRNATTIEFSGNLVNFARIFNSVEEIEGTGACSSELCWNIPQGIERFSHTIL